MTVTAFLTWVIRLGAIILLWLGVAYLRLGTKMHMRTLSIYGLCIISLSLALVIVPRVLTTNPAALVVLAAFISLLTIALIRINQTHHIHRQIKARGVNIRQLLLMQE